MWLNFTFTVPKISSSLQVEPENYALELASQVKSITHALNFKATFGAKRHQISLNFYKTIRSLEAAVSSRRTKCVNLSFARIVKSRSPQAKLEVVSIHRAYARVAIVKREQKFRHLLARVIAFKSRVVVVARVIRRHGTKNYAMQGKISRRNERVKLKSNLCAEQKAP